jgi:endo-1,3-1,4-beta-glycanase ExoK
MRLALTSLGFLGLSLLSTTALAVKSAELYTTTPYGYGRVEARLRFAAGDGVVSSFFLWKDGSEISGTFWNELDFEKIGAACSLKSNAFFGNPASVHNQDHALQADLCGAFHTYAYEWTPDAIAWFVDGVEVRRETGATATAFADNAGSVGMQIRLNVWPGDITFGGNFDPSILPVHQYVDWVQFSGYDAGAFTLAWREEFDGATLPAGWAAANWGSPKNLSTHEPRNINFIDGHAVLSLTSDEAVGPAGAVPVAAGGASGTGGSAGSGTAGAAAAGASGMGASSGAPSSSGGSAGSPSGAESEDAGDSGCSLSTSGERDRSAWLGAFGLAALAALGRRRVQQ